ncbi:MAG TPA: nickel-type superoxide dismutase maturation protease [Candidatus Limnocylindria bacterium]|nr:nickel-type superoxide dismutase maturation protease [Candidatus Limnocylindria bacterium]
MPAERGPRRALFLFLGSLAGIAATAVAAGRRLDVVEVTGHSMAPTLLPGDRLLVEALSYRRRPPRPGEIVLARDPRQRDRELVKRISHVDPSSGSAELEGDAADDSTDSRTFGPVPLEDVRWRAVVRCWPLGRIGRLRGR